MRIDPKPLFLLFLAYSFLMSAAESKEYHVAPNASGPGDGSLDSPFLTIAQAASLLQAGDICHLHGGVYRETVLPEHSGTPEAPIIFRAYRDEIPIISACEPVKQWSREEEHLFAAPTTLEMGHENQVFRGGKMLLEARWPNAPGEAPRYLLEFPMATMKKGTTPTKIVDDMLPPGDWSNANAWISSHKRWYCWTTRVTESEKGAIHIIDHSDSKGNHVCKVGGYYYLFGAKSLLDHWNEWYYDTEKEKLYLWNENENDLPENVEVKARKACFDLRGREHVVLEGLHLFGGTILTDAHSRNLVFDGITAEYVDHSNQARRQYGSQSQTGIHLQGERHVIQNSEIAYSSGNCLVLSAKHCRVINNYIHDGDYIGGYPAPLNFARGSTGNIVSHNTITRSGRTPVGVSGFHASLLQYNDISFGGYLSNDLGLTYGNGVEGGNSEVRYNWLHDNVAESHNMGLYFDHGCKNVIYHHNVIWNTVFAGIINNQYANYLLYFHNTVSDADPSYQSSWAAAQKKDLYGCRLQNNVGSHGTRIKAEGMTENHNLWEYRDLREKRFLPNGSKAIDAGIVIPGINDSFTGEAPDLGAYEKGRSPWKPGHDFDNPPQRIDTSRSPAPYRNRLRNPSFFDGKLTGWKQEGKHIRVIEDYHSQWETEARTMMGGYSAEFGEGPNRIMQKVEGLLPNTTYEMMTMFRVPQGEEGRLSVIHPSGRVEHGKPVQQGAPGWVRSTLRFTTQEQQQEVVISIEKVSPGKTPVYVDDPGLMWIESSASQKSFEKR